MKKLVLALLFFFPLQVLLAQNVKVVPASINSSSKKESTVDYKPSTSGVNSDLESHGATHKKVKCVPGHCDRKQCIRKTSSSNTPPVDAEERTIKAPKK